MARSPELADVAIVDRRPGRLRTPLVESFQAVIWHALVSHPALAGEAGPLGVAGGGRRGVSARRRPSSTVTASINELVADPGQGLPESPLRGASDVALIAGAAAACAAGRGRARLLVGVSNQPAAAKGNGRRSSS